MSYCKGTGTSNFPLRGGKHTLFEGGVRGVALIHAPGLLQGKTNYSSIFSIADFFPTLLSAAGISEMRNAASTYNGDAPALASKGSASVRASSAASSKMEMVLAVEVEVEVDGGGGVVVFPATNTKPDLFSRQDPCWDRNEGTIRIACVSTRF